MSSNGHTATGTIKVASLSKTESYGINGDVQSVRHAVNKFLNRELDEEVEGVTIRQDNRTLSDENLDREARDGDVIMVFQSASIAEGGVKGA